MFASCVICGDAFMNNVDISAVSCGHTFHTVCILQWFENSKTCPQCRVKTTEKKLVRLFFDSTESEREEQDAGTLQSLLDNTKFQIKLKEQEIINFKKELSLVKSNNEELLKEIRMKTEAEKTQASLICSLEAQLRLQSNLSKKMEKLKEERDHAVCKARSMHELQLMLSGTEREVENMLSNYSASCDNEAARNLANVCVLLKREMLSVTEKKKAYSNELRDLRTAFHSRKHALMAKENEVKQLKEKVKYQDQDIQRLEKENESLTKKISALESAMISPSGNDVVKGALRRLLHENVTPEQFKRVLSNDVGDACTPEVIRKNPRMEELNHSVDLFDDSDVGVSSKADQEKSSKSFSLNLEETVHESPSSSSSPYLKVKSSSMLPMGGRQLHGKIGFSKQIGFSKFKSVDISHKETGINYDGMGGHHKFDEFPKPSAVNLKKRVPSIKPPAARPMKMSIVTGRVVKTKTLDNFFKNPFEE